MAADWSTTADYTFAQQDLWKSKITSIDNTTDFKAVAEAPENMMLDPEDYDIFPEQIQVDNESWTATNLYPAATQGWTTVSSGTIS